MRTKTIIILAVLSVGIISTTGIASAVGLPTTFEGFCEKHLSDQEKRIPVSATQKDKNHKDKTHNDRADYDRPRNDRADYDRPHYDRGAFWLCVQSSVFVQDIEKLVSITTASDEKISELEAKIASMESILEIITPDPVAATCSSGSLDGDTCVASTYCNAGFPSANNMCAYEVSSGATCDWDFAGYCQSYSCGDGWSLSGDRCYKTNLTESVCPAGTLKDSDQCLSDPICPEDYTFSAESRLCEIS